MNNTINSIKYLKLYISILFIFSVFYLYGKYNVGNDSTVSEWLINYEGGFTKRGLIGQIAIHIGEFLNISLRQSILFFQIFSIGLYYLLLINFFKSVKFNKIILLSIFTPIFLLYPVAEIEVLGRKEIIIFSFYLIYLTLQNFRQKNYFRIFLLPLLMLVWEPVIFFFIFWLIVDYIEDAFEKNYKSLFKYLLTYIPAILIGAYIALNPISEIAHKNMAIFLKENFNENCYMSCALLLSKSSIYDQFKLNFDIFSFGIFLRYFLIILIGFGPLFILIKFSQFNKLNSKIFLFIIMLPILVLFLMMSDWGRIVNIFYTFSIISFLYLYKKKLVLIDNGILENFFVKIFNKKYIYVIFFIIFCFGWNPKTSLTGDIGTNPLWKIPYNASKKILGFDSLRLFQDNPFIKWHKKYIE
ncbi:hypothetical protein [Candidatus Pelagibacter sp.]|uniref:hypothetical protein n=1 Tax=Candidatus Pelagibacter sp. TaxID=2024849 RepID=UPI003F87F198